MTVHAWYIHVNMDTCALFMYTPSANAVILLLVALLYFYRVEENKILHGSFYPVDFLYIVVGLELLFALPCLIYYIGQFLHVDNIAVVCMVVRR